jgi:hypothetical protein
MDDITELELSFRDIQNIFTEEFWVIPNPQKVFRSFSEETVNLTHNQTYTSVFKEFKLIADMKIKMTLKTDVLSGGPKTTPIPT